MIVSFDLDDTLFVSPQDFKTGTDAADAEDMFKKTDTAMYQSKRNGKHTYTFYAG